MYTQLLKILALIIAAGLLLLAIPEPAEAAKACGGLNQSSCWNVNPAKWCKGNLQYKPTGVPGKGRCVKKPTPKPKKICGGLNQSSCWHVDPTKWCKGNLQYKPTGVPGKGTCVTRPAKAPCGGEGEKSCWNINPAKWCEDGLKYKPTGIPGQGRCIRKVSDDELRDVASEVVARIKSLGSDNPLNDLRMCLKRPENYSALQSAMTSRSANGVNNLLRLCGVSPQALEDYAHRVLGSFNGNAANSGSYAKGSSMASLASTSVRGSSSGSRGKSVNLAIGLGLSGVAKVGVEGGVGYRIELRSNPEARFFVSGGLAAGIGLSGSADVSVGLSYGNMPTAHWARESGVSVSYSGKYVYGGGAAIDFSTNSFIPEGFTISGSAGAGVEAGVVTATGTQYLYNF